MQRNLPIHIEQRHHLDPHVQWLCYNDHDDDYQHHNHHNHDVRRLYYYDNDDLQSVPRHDDQHDYQHNDRRALFLSLRAADVLSYVRGRMHGYFLRVAGLHNDDGQPLHHDDHYHDDQRRLNYYVNGVLYDALPDVLGCLRHLCQSVLCM